MIKSGIRGRSPWSALVVALIFGLSASWASARADDARPRIAFIGLHGGVYEALEPVAKELDIRTEYVSDAEIAEGRVDLSVYRVILIQHVREENRDQYRSLFLAAKKANPGLHILEPRPGTLKGIFDDLGDRSPIEFDAEVDYSPASRAHLRRFLIALSVKYLGARREIPPPVAAETRGLFHPDHPGRFESVDSLLAWSSSRGKPPEGRPRVAVIAHQTHLEFQQAKVVDALIREFEKRGVLAAAFVDSKEQKYEVTIKAFHPDLVVHTCHTQETVELREALDAPHIHSVYFRKQSIEQYKSSLEGIAAGESMLHVIGPERLGEIEPLVTSGTVRGGGSEEAFTPIPERVEHLVDRGLSWIKLRRTPDAVKKVAILYYDRELGKSELMRGSPTGMFMNAPRSIVRLLQKMKAEGYSFSRVPSSDEELLGWMKDHGRQVGLWDPAELDRLARSGKAVLIPEKAYRGWFESRVPETVRGQVLQHWGAAPGQFMVWENQGEKFIVIPRIDMGGVILLPQPLRGEVQDPTRLHTGVVAPPHNYLATYFWLEQEFGADALIHFGTHGNEFGLPAKQVGLSERDWPDILLGRMPNINPWIIENTAEAPLVKRRAYGVLVGHLPPPVIGAGLSDDLLNLQGLIEKYKSLEENGVRQAFLRQIEADVARLKLAGEAGVPGDVKSPLTPEQVDRVGDYLHELATETTPVSLHVLGEPPREDLLIPYLVTILKRRFLDGLSTVIPIPASSKSPAAREAFLRPRAEQAIELVVRRGLAPREALLAVGASIPREVPEDLAKGFAMATDLAERFGETHNEIDGILKVLDGRFLPAGPVNSPIRNPAAVPTGRNLYTLNPEEIPTRPSWEVGKRLVDQLLKRSMDQKGRYPTRVGFTLGSMASFRDFGVMESQILNLLGVEPVWDEKDLVNDVRLIPASQLNRPRIDVFIANYSGGRYSANLPGRLELIDKAIRLVADLDEKDNPVRGNTLAIRADLEKAGLAPERAAALSRARIFGPHLGDDSQGSGGIFALVQQSGSWEQREQIAAEYLAGVQHAYTQGHWGERAPEAYRAAIQGTETIVRSWSDSLRGPLSSKYYWIQGGSLSLAVKQMTGKEPEFLLSDVRDFDKAQMVRAEDALVREARARLFNRKWIEGMMKEGYAGADQVAVLTSNAMGWSVVRPESIPQHTWAQIEAVYVRDELGLSIREWFESQNPFAFQEVSSTLVESIRKGYWKADAATSRRVAEAYARSVIRHGDSGGLRSGGNVALNRYVERTLNDSGSADLASISKTYRSRIDAMTAPTSQATVAQNSPAPAVSPPLAAAPPISSSPAASSPPAPATAAPPSTPRPTGPSQGASDVVEATRLAEASVVPGPKPSGGAPTQASRNVPGPSSPADPTSPLTSYAGWILGAVGLMLVLGGFFRRRNPA
ncbi:cobaltochelatase subunit CobN [Aquisphaera insulae]|uniref:cobaltochelatase subunit CobN n=1 Tax=Aquisphaera insulae TaxID=2712864 RepID=UPI0013EA4182|nr:cobaltochelatase subunit CobN [Aquisphaera insulae]